MQYTISIDNITSSEWGLNIAESYLFAWLYNVPTWADPVTIAGEVFFFANRYKVVSDLNGFNKPDTVYRHLKSLEEKGVIQYRKQGKRDCIAITEKGKSWGRTRTPINSEIFPNSEKNPRKLGKKSEINSEIFPTDSSTIIHSDIIKTEKGERENFKPRKELTPDQMAEWFKRKIITDGDGYFGSQVATLRSEFKTDVFPIIKDVLNSYAENDQWANLMVPTPGQNTTRYINKVLARAKTFLKHRAKDASRDRGGEASPGTYDRQLA